MIYQILPEILSAEQLQTAINTCAEECNRKNYADEIVKGYFRIQLRYLLDIQLERSKCPTSNVK